MTVPSTAVNLSAQVRRTSAENADVRTYRVDVRIHAPSTSESANGDSPANGGTASCQPEIAYRVEYTAPPGPVGTRQALFVDSEPQTCGGRTSGPAIGCHRLLTPEIPTVWSNESATAG